MYDIKHKKGKTISISISDLINMYCRNSEMTRLDIVVRVLAVENYYGLNNFGFDIYKIAQIRRKSNEFAVNSVEGYKKLIASCEKNGYKENSLISLDRNLSLIDGSYRIAMGIYNNLSRINALVVNETFTVDYSIDWFIKENFSHEHISIIKKKANTIVEKYKDNIACVVWGPAVIWIDEILEDISSYGEVLGLRRITLIEENYEKITREIYEIDDIAEWKVNKKLEHMKGCTEIIYFELNIEHPEFRIKKMSNMPICINGERLKKAIRSKYSLRMEDYYYDIILHTADNYTQSQEIRRIVGV